MSRETVLLRRIRIVTCLFIAGLVISGVTAIPLVAELEWLADQTGARALAVERGIEAPSWATWLLRVEAAVLETAQNHPFLFYGTDWLAFGHFVIAIAFVGALRDPVRNRWLFTFGLIACVLVIPYALVFGGIRGIPYWWRGIDSLFGAIGFVPLWFCHRWVRELDTS